MVREHVHAVYECEVCGSRYTSGEEAERCEKRPVIQADYSPGQLLMLQSTRQPVMVINIKKVGHEFKHRLQYITGNEILMGNDRNLIPASDEVIDILNSWTFLKSQGMQQKPKTISPVVE